jgi:thioredoxin 1
MLAPTIDKIAEQYAGRVKVGKLNTDNNQDTAVRYGISTIPQVLIFRGGEQPRERIPGIATVKELEKLIDGLLSA